MCVLRCVWFCSKVSLDRVRAITGVTGDQLKFVEGDVQSAEDLDRVFSSDTFTSVIHFAAL